MTRLGKFITADELDRVKTAQSVSGMYLSGGRPMGDPADKDWTAAYPDCIGLLISHSMLLRAFCLALVKTQRSKIT